MNMEEKVKKLDGGHQNLISTDCDHLWAICNCMYYLQAYHTFKKYTYFLELLFLDWSYIGADLLISAFKSYAGMDGSNWSYDKYQ